MLPNIPQLDPNYNQTITVWNSIFTITTDWKKISITIQPKVCE